MIKKLWRIVAILVLLSVAAAVNSPSAVYAQSEEPHTPVYCGQAEVNSCRVLNPKEIAVLKNDAEFEGLYLSHGKNQYRLNEAWRRLPNPAGWSSFGLIDQIPSEVHKYSYAAPVILWFQIVLKP